MYTADLHCLVNHVLIQKHITINMRRIPVSACTVDQLLMVVVEHPHTVFIVMVILGLVYKVNVDGVDRSSMVAAHSLQQNSMNIKYYLLINLMKNL